MTISRVVANLVQLNNLTCILLNFGDHLYGPHIRPIQKCIPQRPGLHAECAHFAAHHARETRVGEAHHHPFAFGRGPLSFFLYEGAALQAAVVAC